MGPNLMTYILMKLKMSIYAEETTIRDYITFGSLQP